ncbi:MAG: hypothetical protein HC848_02165 [Limnobacter sp.]|nr:hypothetical protein [Limnobacter sp.]
MKEEFIGAVMPAWVKRAANGHKTTTEPLCKFLEEIASDPAKMETFKTVLLKTPRKEIPNINRGHSPFPHSYSMLHALWKTIFKANPLGQPTLPVHERLRMARILVLNDLGMSALMTTTDKARNSGESSEARNSGERRNFDMLIKRMEIF